MSLDETIPIAAPIPPDPEVCPAPPEAAATTEPAAAVPAAEDRAADPVDLVALALAAVERAVHLPRGMRARFDSLLTADRLSLDSAGRACVTLDDALAAFEASLPRQWLNDSEQLPPAVHPSGDQFFTGAGDELSDERAEAIARGQLERAGFLRRPGA